MTSDLMLFALLAAVSAVALATVFETRQRWLDARMNEMVFLLPHLERLDTMTSRLSCGKIEHDAFSAYFDGLVHMFLSSAFHGKAARELLERRLHSALEEAVSSGFEIDNAFAGDKFGRTRLFLLVIPSWKTLKSDRG